MNMKHEAGRAWAIGEAIEAGIDEGQQSTAARSLFRQVLVPQEASRQRRPPVWAEWV